MCGIVGYVGKEQASPILLDGLEKLEYRGYDSAGVCVYQDGALKIGKSKGRLQNLYNILDGGKKLQGTTGIGHTRWATHGAPSDENSHPHISDFGKIAVVHNGIIENYIKIKEMLQSKGVSFQSETDTEVVAHLIEYFYMGDFQQAVFEALSWIEGSYALGILCSDFPNTVIAVKKDSPLVVGIGEGCNYIASDVPAILKYTRNVYYLNDGDMAVLTPDSITFFDVHRQPLVKKSDYVQWEVSAAEKGGYEHFMFKEIMEQPKAVRDTISPRIKNGRVVLDGIEFTKEYFDKINRIYIVACGSAYYVGVLGKYIIEKLVRKPVEAMLASEFRYCDPIVDTSTLVIIISQSGETADTLAALREAKSRGARALAVVNVVGSSITKEADETIYTWAGPEIAVATTKAYSTQLSVMYLLALYFADLCGMIGEGEYNAILTELQAIPEKIGRILEKKESVQYYGSRYFNNEDVFFIGRNLDNATCLEGSLKLKEIAYIHSEAYAAGELKHGPISLIKDGTLVVAVATNVEMFDKMMSNVKEVKARGAEVLGITTERFAEEILKTVDAAFVVPETHPILQASLSVIPLQMFSYFVSLMRGCDIDKPRNLAKSVTVE